MRDERRSKPGPAAARPAANAFDRFVRAIRDAAGCVTAQPLLVTPGGVDPSVLYAITFGPSGDPVRLRGSDGDQSGLMFDLRQTFRLVDRRREHDRPGWAVSTVAYQYRLLDLHHRELLVWHWQPGSAFSGPDHPHIHVSAALTASIGVHDAAAVRSIPLDRLHLATGYVSLEGIIRTLIEDFAITPVPRRRTDWRATIDRTNAVFRSETIRQP